MPLTDIATITVSAAWVNNPDDASPTWYTVPAVEQVQIGPRGRHYELDTVNPTRATIRIDNSDGLYSSGSTIFSGATVTPDRPIRVRAAVPVTTTTTTTPGKGTFGGQSFAAGPFGSFIAITTTTTGTVTTTYTLAKHTIESAPSRLDSGGFDYASSTFTTIDYQDALAARTLKSCYNEQTIYEQPTAYYPMSEPAGRTSIGDVIGGLVAPIRLLTAAGTSSPGVASLGATPFFGSTDTSTNASFAPHISGTAPSLTVDGGCAYVLGSNGVGTFITASTWAIRLTFATTYSDSSGYLFYQANVDSTALNNPAYISIGNSGSLSWVFGNAYGSTSATYNDGYAHTIQVIGNATNTRVWIDGVLISTGVASTGTGFNTIGQCTIGAGINVNGNLADSYAYHGQIGHVAIWNGSSPSDTTSYVSATKGFINETADTRIARLLNWSKFSGSTSLDSTCSTPLGAMDCSGQTVLQQCQDTANAEDGLFYIKGDGTPRLRSRASRYSLASVATFGSTTYPVETSQLEFSYDRQHVVNDAYVTRPAGPTLRVVNSTSVTAHRTRTANLTFSVNSDDQLLQAANWYLYRYANPVLRVGTISFRPFTTPGLATLACTLEPGDKITVNNLPSQAPASSMDFIIESIGHANITNSDWTVELSLSPWIAPVVIDDTSHYGYIDDYISNPTAYGVLIY